MLPDRAEPAQDADREPTTTAPLRRRAVIAALLSVPVLLLSMIPALQFDNWQWLSLKLATPVVLWGAWPFHRAAWANLRHGAATMDTLVSASATLAAWLWSLYALFIGDAGMNGMRMAFELIPKPGEGADQIYLETAGIVTMFLLAGRYFEARAKRRAGAALTALLELGRQGRRACSTPTAASAASRSSSSRSATASSSAPARRSPPTASSRTGASAVDMSMLTGESVPVEVAPGRRGRRRDRQRRRAPRRPRHARSAPTPRSRRSPGWSPTRRPARRPSSGSPTASPASSSRS